MQYKKLLYPQANVDNTYQGVGAVVNVVPRDIHSQKRLRECVEDLLVPAAQKHAVALLPREALDFEDIDILEGLAPVKDGMNSAQLHYHPDSIEFASTGSTVDTVVSDTMSAARNILHVLESPATRAILRKSGDNDADVLVMAALDFLQKANMEHVPMALRIDQARRAYTVLYLLLTTAKARPELYQVLREVQMNMQADLFAIPWKEYGYAVMHSNVTHARNVIHADTRTDSALFVRTRKEVHQ